MEILIGPKRVLVPLLALALACGLHWSMAAAAFAPTDARVYEMVSPVYKGGYGAIHIEGVSQNGQSAAFFSPGVFAGAPSGPTTGAGYIARRESTGWSTTPLMPPADLLPYVVAQDISPSLETAIALGKPGTNQEGAYQKGNEEEFLLHSTDLADMNASWEVGGFALKDLNETTFSLGYRGSSADFCHLLFASAGTPLLRQGGSTNSELYDLNSGCNGEPPSLQLVGSNNRGKPLNSACLTDLGIAYYSSVKKSAYNAIAAGGNEIFFTTCVGGTTSPHELFVRLSGERTLEISKPMSEKCEEVPCGGASKRASAEFVGASEDGSKVFFTTTAPLTGEGSGAGNDLYMATIGCPREGEGCEPANKVVTSLVDVTHDVIAGQNAAVQGVVRVAPDGSRVYFVARGSLTSGPNAEGEMPIVGADNLYVYDSAENTLAFVAELCTGQDLSGPPKEGPVEDLHCPSGGEGDTSLWSGGFGEAQTAGADGRYLVFSSYTQLVASDTDTAKDVYRYDAETGRLVRISTGEDGYDANGNRNDGAEENGDALIAPGNLGESVRQQYELNSRAINEEGSRIVFRTAEPLSPQAINHLTNIYEWHEIPGGSEGEVSLISSGSAEEAVEDAVISPDGDDIFFVTVQGLVPQDTDGAPDVYDARVNGGFPAPPTAEKPCSGEACQGPLSNPAPLLVPASVVQVPGEDFAPPKATKKPKPKSTLKPKPRKKRKTKAKHATRTRSHATASMRHRGR